MAENSLSCSVPVDEWTEAQKTTGNGALVEHFLRRPGIRVNTHPVHVARRCYPEVRHLVFFVSRHVQISQKRKFARQTIRIAAAESGIPS